MNRFTELKSKLKTTPRRAAIEYITSIHRRTEAEGMKVLVQRIEEMRAVIQEFEYFQIFNAHAFQQTCFFVELYCFAVNELSAALISLMELNKLVSSYCNFRPSPCSSLFDCMAPEYNSLQIRFETVGLIQETHLRTWILPQHYGLLTDSQLERCQLLRAWVADDPARASSGLYQPGEALEAEQAQMEAYIQAKMEAYISVIGSHASLENVRMSGIYLTHAEQQVFLSYSKHKQFAELLAIRRGHTILPQESHYLHNEDIRDPGLNDQ
jgi:hypothetical protein